MYACIYRPPAPEDDQRSTRGTRREDVGAAGAALNVLVEIAAQFSPRYEQHRDDLVSIDVSGLERLLGPAQAIGEELRRTATARGVRLHVAIARSRIAALVLALARPGLTVVAPGEEAAALAPIAIGILEKIDQNSAGSPVSALKRWGLKTLGELAALPPADLASRLGRPALAWQAMARGEDARPLVPMVEEERFDASLELEWPIDGLEPLSFVFTRLLEPLSTRLERRDRGAAVLHVLLRLVTKDASGAGHEMYTRRLELPTPMRDVRALRTLALLDLESHPPGAAIDRVTIAIDPTPGRVLQHTLFTRAQPAPEQVSTLLARLGALMGQDRIGAPAIIDTYRPGAFAMTAFKTDDDDRVERRAPNARTRLCAGGASDAAGAAFNVCSALRRCRQPVPARVAIADGRPIRVTTDRRGFAGGAVVQCAGPWRTSGNWWAETHPTHPTHPTCWSRDEWDVAVSDGAVYRIFEDRATNAWFVDAIVD